MGSRVKGKTAMEVGADGVAIINPPVNLLSADGIPPVYLLSADGSKGKFSGGFDVSAFGKKVEAKHDKLGFWSIEFITDTLEAAKKPLVAAIDGPAFGGGVEIAQACHGRISTSTAQLGLPELQFGILPGFGGRVRRQALLELWQSDTCKSLVHIFFAQRGTTKITGITDLGLVSRKVNNSAIIGGGLMGSGIATALIHSNYSVILKEINDKFLMAGIDRVKESLQTHAKKRKMTQVEIERSLSLLKGVLNYESFGNVDLGPVWIPIHH